MTTQISLALITIPQAEETRSSHAEDTEINTTYKVWLRGYRLLWRVKGLDPDVRKFSDNYCAHYHHVAWISDWTQT